MGYFEASYFFSTLSYFVIFFSDLRDIYIAAWLFVLWMFITLLSQKKSKWFARLSFNKEIY